MLVWVKTEKEGVKYVEVENIVEAYHLLSTYQLSRKGGFSWGIIN